MRTKAVAQSIPRNEQQSQEWECRERGVGGARERRATIHVMAISEISRERVAATLLAVGSNGNGNGSALLLGVGNWQEVGI
jgi:hypothetical protein